MAGYEEPMEEFFRANPGMGSRVAHHIGFPDYDADELMQIGRLMVGQRGHELSGAAAAALRDYVERRRERPRFAHGRSIRNAIERARMRQAARLFDSTGKVTPEGRPHQARARRLPAELGVRHERHGRLMPRPVILGVVGDSAAGKTTISRGLVRILGEDRVTHVCTDDYHRYDRRQRADLGITPLHPDCNYLDIAGQHLEHLREGEAILKPVHRHADGTFGEPVYVKPHVFTIVEVSSATTSPAMRDCAWTCASTWRPRRTSAVSGRCNGTALAAATRPTRCWASWTGASRIRRPSSVRRNAARTSWSRLAGESGERSGLPRRRGGAPRRPPPPGSVAVHRERSPRGLGEQRGSERHVHIPGDIDPGRAKEMEEAIWEKLHFATHLRSQRLGEFTVGIDLHRSESLALVQLLILYHLVARAAIALGGDGTRETDLSTV